MLRKVSDREIRVLYEDENLVALDKPAGVLVHPVEGKEENGRTVADWLREHYPETGDVGDRPDLRPGIVHRLDRDTSGVLVAARSQDAFAYLKSLFQRGEVQKVYIALVYGVPSPQKGVIDVPISIKPGTVRRTVHKGKMKKKAVTEYKVIKGLGRYALVEVYPKTGRTHQIRVHLASVGHPIVGDSLYASKRKPQAGAGRLMLHAASLEFTSPDGKRLMLSADIPSDMKAVLQTLGGAATISVL